jgi:parvulin-like peptidyl-prolyl isomerase
MKKINVRHILVQHEYQAMDLMRNISSGEDFARLAKKYSLCASAPGGGNLGPVLIDRLDDQFAEALIELSKYEISKPVRTKFGWHLIQKLD